MHAISPGSCNQFRSIPKKALRIVVTGFFMANLALAQTSCGTTSNVTAMQLQKHHEEARRQRAIDCRKIKGTCELSDFEIVEELARVAENLSAEKPIIMRIIDAAYSVLFITSSFNSEREYYDKPTKIRSALALIATYIIIENLTKARIVSGSFPYSVERAGIAVYEYYFHVFGFSEAMTKAEREAEALRQINQLPEAELSEVRRFLGVAKDIPYARIDWKFIDLRTSHIYPDWYALSYRQIAYAAVNLHKKIYLDDHPELKKE